MVNNKSIYVTPAIELLFARVEKGFTISNQSLDPTPSGDPRRQAGSLQNSGNSYNGQSFTWSFVYKGIKNK